MKKLLYCVVDTETATLPFVNEIAATAEEKKTIAIAKPLIYDIGWTICDRAGTIYDRKQFLVAETFSVPAVFNTAYYADKRPRYLEMLDKNEITVKPWREVMQIFIQDISTVDAVGAFNSMFDFKKAIPFTELYINKLYSPDYNAWEYMQKEACRFILTHTPKSDKEFEKDLFRFRGVEYPLFDLWGLAAKHLLNNVTYKKQCLAHDMLTASGVYFKTSAETAYRYLCNKYEFVESHTALDDATIETFILSKIANRHKIDIGIIFFPFRELGETDAFVQRLKTPNMEECQKVYDAIATYIDGKEQSNYTSRLQKKLDKLTEYMNT